MEGIYVLEEGVCEEDETMMPGGRLSAGADQVLTIAYDFFLQVHDIKQQAECLHAKPLIPHYPLLTSLYVFLTGQ